MNAQTSFQKVDSDDESVIGDIISSKNAMPNIEWTTAHEDILIEWADKALCFKWLHAKSHQVFSKSNAWFTIPVIIMSTLTGTANFAQDRFADNIKPYVAMTIGTVNIFAGILTTIQQFLKIGELNEAHRASSIAWDKFYRNIKVELAKSPNERVPVMQMLKIYKEEFDRLMETSPSISEKIIEEFKSVFSGGKINGELTEKQKAFKLLKKPEICDTIETTRTSVYKKSVTLKNPATLISKVKKTLADEKRIKEIEVLINNLEEELGRPPTTQEIIDELDYSISEEFLNKIKNKFLNNIKITIHDNDKKTYNDFDNDTKDKTI